MLLIEVKTSRLKRLSVNILVVVSCFFCGLRHSLIEFLGQEIIQSGIFDQTVARLVSRDPVYVFKCTQSRV